MLHAQLHLHAALTKRTKGRSLGNRKQSNARTDIGDSNWQKHKQVYLRVNQERLLVLSTTGRS
jgi:hypothetical protein